MREKSRDLYERVLGLSYDYGYFGLQAKRKEKRNKEKEEWAS